MSKLLFWHQLREFPGRKGGVAPKRLCLTVYNDWSGLCCGPGGTRTGANRMPGQIGCLERVNTFPVGLARTASYFRGGSLLPFVSGPLSLGLPPPPLAGRGYHYVQSSAADLRNLTGICDGVEFYATLIQSLGEVKAGTARQCLDIQRAYHGEGVAA